MQKQKVLGAIAYVIFVTLIISTFLSLPVFDQWRYSEVVRWVPTSMIVAFGILWVIAEITDNWEIRRKD